MRRIITALLIGVICSWAVFAAQDAATITYDEASETYARMAELLDEVSYLTTSAIWAYTGGAIKDLAQGVLNLLVGPEGEDYDPENPVVIPDEAGLIPMIEAQRRPHTRNESVFYSPFYELFPDYQIRWDEGVGDFPWAWHQVAVCLRLAADVARDIVTSSYTRKPWEAEVQTLHALILSARGTGDPYAQIDGVKTLAALFPSPEIWVHPWESIQAAVDRVPEGGTIYIEPGTYEEALEIGRSVNLVAASHAPGASPDLGVTVLQAGRWTGGIEIEADDPIEVSIRGLAIRERGVSVTRNAAVLLEECRFIDDGLSVGQFINPDLADTTSTVSCLVESCLFSGEGAGIGVGMTATVAVRDTIVEGSGSWMSAPVSVQCGELTLENCEIRDNVNFGVRVAGGALTVFHMTNCRVIRNGRGLKIETGTCESWSIEPEPGKSLTEGWVHGQITGWGNEIPGPGEPDGNEFEAIVVHSQRDTGFLPDVSFLTEPKPESTDE